MKVNKKIPIIIGIVVVVLGLIGLGALRWWQGETPDEIRISGNIEMTEVKIGFKIAGKLVALAANEGDRVQQGAVVAQLDQEQLAHQRDSAQAAVTAAQGQLEQLFTAIAYQKEMLESQIDQRQAELNATQAQLDKLLAGSRNQEILQAKAAVQEAQAQFDRTERDWRRAQQLYQSNTISTAQYDQARTQHDGAAAMLTQAKERTALVVEGARKEDIKAAYAQVALATAGMRAAQANRLELQRREQEVSVRKADIQRAQAQLALVEAQLKDAQAISPVDGVVLVKAAECGEILAPGTTVLTLGDLDHPWLRGYIKEQDLGRIRQGQPAEVTTDSFPGKRYAGRITFISSEAEFTPKQIQTTEERVKLVYRIKIEVENPQHELKLNMPADASIKIAP